MSVIVISKGSYSHGTDVAENVARRLGFDCISRAILLEISKKFNIPEIKLIRSYEDAPSLLERYNFGREKYIAYIRSAILDNLAKGNIVYHGFYGHFFVSNVSHVLKVRIIADMEERVRYMMKRENLSNEEAIKWIERIDEGRRNWSLKLYGIDTWDCRLYDLVIKIGKYTVDDAVDMICQTVRLKAFQPTTTSQAKIEELAMESRLELEEKSKLSPFLEPMRVSPWSKQREMEKD
jgi:cytidylate kinase